MRYAFLAISVACVWAQPKVDIHHVSGRASDRLKEAERRWRTAGQRSWHDAATPEEQSVIAAATRFYGQFFQPELRSAPRIATFTEKGQDVLVGRWTIPSNECLCSELIIWDTPQDTCFVFRLPHGSWLGDPAIRSNFEALLLPARPDGKTPPAKGVTVNIARDPYTRQWVGAGGLLINYFPRQFDTGYMNWFDLWETNDESYLAVTFSQFAIPEFPPDMRSIAERFPPLQSRVGRWSKERLVNELTHAGGFGTSVRDRVLSRELLRRDLTDDELLLLLKRRIPDESGTVLATIVDAHQVTRFVRAIREYLRSAIGGENKANHPFDIIRRTDQANFTDAAIEVLRQDYRANPAFRYAAAHGTTLSDYNALAELPRLDASYREWCLSEMCRRLGLSR